jgi:hypothetical protein
VDKFQPKKIASFKGGCFLSGRFRGVRALKTGGLAITGFNIFITAGAHKHFRYVLFFNPFAVLLKRSC